MGKLKYLLIDFDRGNIVYSPGDTIRGKVMMEVDEIEAGNGLQDVAGIWVRFRGKAKTKFTPKSEEAVCVEKEHYFNTTLTVFGRGPGQVGINNLTLPLGRHIFPFAFQIPRQPVLPSSFEGKRGYVRYKAKVTVCRNKTFSDKRYREERLFKVAGPAINLNNIPDAEVAVCRNTPVMTCCGCNGEDIESIISVGLPRQGYLPGEIIHVFGYVDNRVGDERMDFGAVFLQETIFMSQQHSKRKKIILFETSTEVMCPKGRVTEFSIGSIPVAADLPPTGLPGCSIIDINYKVKVKAAACHEIFPIAIGTAAPQSPPVVDTAPTANNTEDFTEIWGGRAAPVQTDESPPPSYEEAVGAY